MQIADRQKGLNEGDAGVTGAYDDNSGILYDLCLREHSSCGEAEGERSFLLIQRVSSAAVNSVLDIFLLLLLGVLRVEPFVVPFSIQKVRESSASDMD